VHAAARSHVHLAPAVDATVGKRAAVDVLLVIDPEKLRAAGERIFRAPNGVLLTRLVPRDAVVGIRAATRMGDTRLAALRDLLVHQP
jgi:putative RNA 2'-phosphotransferase